MGVLRAGLIVVFVTAMSAGAPDAAPFAFEHGLTCVAFSSDGKAIVGGCPRVEPYVKVWDSRTGRELHRFEAVHHVVSVGFSPDSRHVFAVSLGGMDHIEVWSLETGRRTAKFKIPYLGDFYTCRAAMSPDGKQIASGGLTDNAFRVWSVTDGKLLQTFKGHEAAVWCYAFSPDGATMASGSADGTVRVWDVTSGKQLTKLTGHATDVIAIAFADAGKRIVSGSGDGNVRVWSRENGKLLKSLKIEGSKRTTGFTLHDPFTLGLSSDGGTAVVLAKEGCNCRDVEAGKELSIAAKVSAPFALSPDGTVLVVAPANAQNNGGRLTLWSTRTGKAVLPKLDVKKRK